MQKMEGKDVTEVMADGLANYLEACGGGGGGAPAAGGAAAGGAAEEKKQEEEEEEEDMDFDLFG